MGTFQGMQVHKKSQRDAVYILGGATLALLGAGLLLSNRAVRERLGRLDFRGMLAVAMPDVERYLRIRSM
jgi:hypothetical protein